jgi:hypothetical protein
MTFDFFNVTGTTSGDFDHILVSADGYTARFNALDGSLTFAAVPEPSTYATIARALVLSFVIARRSMRSAHRAV